MRRELAFLSARVTTVAHKTDLVISGSTVIVWCVAQAAQAVAGRRIVNLDTRLDSRRESFMRIPNRLQTPPLRTERRDSVSMLDSRDKRMAKKRGIELFSEW